MNIHIIKGRLVRDPELTQAQDPNHDRVNFTVAVSRHYGDETDFIDCVLFGKGAAVIEKFFKKGKEIALEGEGQIRKYKGKDGSNKQSYSIIVNKWEFCGSKDDKKDEQEPVPNFEQAFEDVETDVPF